MTRVEEFIHSYEGNQGRVLSYLHHILAKELELLPKIRFRIPFYYRRSWICYLNPTKRATIEFCFLRGNELSNEQGLLNTNGRKQVAGIEIETLTNLPESELREVIHEALLLDEMVPYSVKKMKKAK
ncbi:MAG: DUF1801 domain-containing protein [Bacteroidota bacterium]